MKPLTALLLMLTCCGFAASECVEVTHREAKPSLANARITVVLDGQPQRNVKLIVTLQEESQLREILQVWSC